MPARTTILCCLLSVAATAQKPAPADQQRTLEAARQFAAQYTAKLPDFICTETIQRVMTQSFRNAQTDKLTFQLTFSGQKENYQLVAINGNKTDQPFQSLNGLVSGGEFGTLLERVFDASSKATFDWKSSTTLRKRRAAIYTYRIMQANSHYVLGYRTDEGKLVTTTAGYHGEVALDGETHRVLRLTAVADDIAKDSGILESSVEVDYDLASIAGKSYLLPAHAQAQMVRPNREIKNEVSFGDYHKFAASSSIDFH